MHENLTVSEGSLSIISWNFDISELDFPEAAEPRLKISSSSSSSSSSSITFFFFFLDLVGVLVGVLRLDTCESINGEKKISISNILDQAHHNIFLY